ncbi:hypothetical protein WJX73_006868 [Symbiochloris irregularis]|uniref:Cyanobacterial aminoacyl-tRNA synthetase CAAD domain-containing protein n=1 Tax=Symbiochloris irregularis TaxID=706552 RepID=A0AAW1NWH9_9CHLO
MGVLSLGSRTLPVQRSQPIIRAALPGPQVPANVRSARAIGSRLGKPQESQRQSVVAQASAGEDFDGILSDIADKFEKSDKKGAIIGYTAAGVLAFFFSEWLIHLPLLNLLLGFPIQLVGLLVLPYLVVKYGVENDDYVRDLKTAGNRVIKKLPGLEK